MRLRYTEKAIQIYDLGVPLLSLSLPMSTHDFPNGVVQPFVRGLLPEGDALLAIADQLDLRASDSYGLIAALGQDCAGALVIQPENVDPPPVPTILTAQPLTESELAEAIDLLRTVPLGISSRVRISLGGVQEKLLLTALSGGTWGRPIDGTPSTHILKPEIRGYPNTVENEAFCMRIAGQLGLPVAEVATTDVRKRPVLIVGRYDRVIDHTGQVDRIHQEDFCQAFALSPDQKYEEHAGPTLRRIASTLEAVAPPGDRDTFLRAVTLNVLVGNGDAHGKNFSLLHEDSGTLRLAPLYDVLSTLFYEQYHLAMYVDKVQRMDRVTISRIVNEAGSWGMRRDRAEGIVSDLVSRMPDAIAAATEETPQVPRRLVDIVQAQLRRVTA